MNLRAIIASIPSPSEGSIHLGPLRLNAYGFMIALGVIVAVRIAGKRAERRGIATRDDLAAIAMWAVPAGVIGARAYHVITDPELFYGHWGNVVKVWQGGLGIWGGVALGVVVGLWRAKKMNLDSLWLLSCAAPAIPVAQAIGRWGNWWNQELFGRPTTLPWALRVSANTARAAGYNPGITFHPTFLYESLGCLLIALLVVLLEKRTHFARGRLFLYYVAGYTFLRFFIEGLRIDPAHHADGLRLNQWVAIAVFATAIVTLLIDRARGGASHSPETDSGSTVSDHE
jgi:prolipoprotein diacylglyceryl transferase